ncbi:C6 zinc finger domain protein [Aspergillus indologenus CBS 114.80]|uniref:C6 zinc finger domain protein n=1 Tax=Aspergillus indologenus CBS 114.80 TaxID=1450541 RepID=A0A2V5I5B7_9EURO|nr:C6 zinc finger domain protein [Aspergillus indologenus CBS 114.80]
MHKLGKKTRSRTGCRTCRIRKVKCDEEKLAVPGQPEPQCRRCTAARILCEWKGGPIPRPAARKTAPASTTKEVSPSATTTTAPSLPQSSRILTLSSPGGKRRTVQAANSLVLTGFDRSCIAYLQDSALVVLLGKHWPWSAMSYAYHKIAVREPMVMSMLLASTASEIRRAQLYDSDQPRDAVETVADLGGRTHYGRALAGLREALRPEVEKSSEQLEAIFITLWLMIDYENRFGSGTAAINVHIRGIESLLFNHVVPLLKPTSSAPALIAESGSTGAGALPWGDATNTAVDSTQKTTMLPTNALPGLATSRLCHTAVPLFLLWTLYFFTPGALFCGPAAARLDADLFRFFIQDEAEQRGLSLAELYRIGRQSPRRFWGDSYPTTAQLDDIENQPALILYHRSHVMQFKITELWRQGQQTSEVCMQSSTPIPSLSLSFPPDMLTRNQENDSLLTTALTAPTCDTASRRVLETIFWATITFYGTIVYFHLCFKDTTAVNQVLSLSLKLHRSRPHLMVRIIWPLFIAGIATPDRIYQDWVSIRLQELGRYGLNYSRVSRRFDEIVERDSEFGPGVVGLPMRIG